VVSGGFKLFKIKICGRGYLPPPTGDKRGAASEDKKRAGGGGQKSHLFIIQINLLYQIMVSP
jgi:hypothetical protein